MLILIAILVVAIYAYIKYGEFWRIFIQNYKIAQLVPGPPFKEIFGKNGSNILPWHRELRKRYGSTFRIWYGFDLFVVFTDPEDVKTILNNTQLTQKSNVYDLVRPWLGNGLLTNGGPSWHQRRKLLTPAFHFKILSSFKDSMEQKCDILIDRLAKVADGRAFDIYPFITLFTLDIISETAMGVKKQVQQSQDSNFVTATKRLLHVFYSQHISVWYRISLIHKFSANKEERDSLIKILHDETTRTIEERRKILQQSDIRQMADDDSTDLGIKRRLAFLDVLLLAQMNGADLSDTDIREEVDTFMFEGHDTTGSALTFAVNFLATHPDVQAKAYAECCQYAGREGEPMKYLEAVIKETLRLCPAVPSFSRRTTESIKIGNQIYPPGVSIAIITHLVHTQPEHYTDPYAFKPERFLDGNDAHPFAFVAFSAGPRNCIGQKFAMLELKCTLSKLLRAYEFRTVDGFQLQPINELVLKSGNGVQVRLSKRN